ncbi:MAG: type III polyketide synthase [Planctomycetota bacterium]
MSARIVGIGCVTPPGLIGQGRMAELSRRYNATTPQQRALIDRVYRGTKIDQRASVLGALDDSSDAATTDKHGLQSPPTASRSANLVADENIALALDEMAGMLRFYPEPEGSLDDAGPSTADRMAAYEALSLPLAAEACRQAIRDAGVLPEQVTQLVSVSCTGFSAPGLEVRLIETLGLNPGTGRTNIGFMGCHGAVNGLRVAGALAATQGDPDARVLMVCTELCTLHFQYGQDPQLAVANALFGDGAAAVVLAQDTHAMGDQDIRLLDTHSTVLPGTAEHMSWRIRDRGFVMALSSEVPRLIEEHAQGVVEPWLARHGLTAADVGGWAIHPGGPKVIGAVESALGLAVSAGDASRAVLAERGNMSSPTVFFIAQRLRLAEVPRPWVLLAFGPGLVIEAALLQ